MNGGQRTAIKCVCAVQRRTRSIPLRRVEDLSLRNQQISDVNVKTHSANRAVTKRDGMSSLVHYWFDGRGRRWRTSCSDGFW
jgi:hypothetical protein